MMHCMAARWRLAAKQTTDRRCNGICTELRICPKSDQPGDDSPSDALISNRFVNAFFFAFERYSSIVEDVREIVCVDASAKACFERGPKRGRTMATRRTGLTVTQLQEQIFAREGFRVSFERLGKSDAPLPPYDYPVMAPTGWKVSDWQRVRLAPYVLLFRGVTVFRGDDKPIARD